MAEGHYGLMEAALVQWAASAPVEDIRLLGESLGLTAARLGLDQEAGTPTHRARWINRRSLAALTRLSEVLLVVADQSKLPIQLCPACAGLAQGPQAGPDAPWILSPFQDACDAQDCVARAAARGELP